MKLPFVDLAGEVLVLVTALSTIGAIVYWVLKRNLIDDFDERYMRMSQCKERHDIISQETREYRDSIKDDLKEIKEVIKEMQEKLYCFMRELAGRK